MNLQADLIGNLSKKSKKKPSIAISSENNPLLRKVEQLEKENALLSSENSSLKELAQDRDAICEVEDLKKIISELENKLSNKKTENSPSSLLSDDDFVTVMKNKELQSVSAINLMNAIDSEAGIQNTEDVIITRKMMIDKYNVNTAFITMAIKALTDNGFIRVNQISTRKRTFRKLKELPSLN